ncbi:MAG: hypothetical protein AAF402_15090 [Pseudomonadota bacterium]
MSQHDDNSKESNRRKVLKGTLAGGAVITTSVLPEKWSKPAVDAVILPSHANTTDSGGGEDTGTTTPEPTTTSPVSNLTVNQSFSFDLDGIS